MAGAGKASSLLRSGDPSRGIALVLVCRRFTILYIVIIIVSNCIYSNSPPEKMQGAFCGQVPVRRRVWPPLPPWEP